MPKYPPDLNKIILSLKQLPGIGFKTAERLAFELLTWPQEKLNHISTVLKEIPDNFANCGECGAIKEKNGSCAYCSSNDRDVSVMCIIAYPKDIFAIESSGTFKGLYHVLGGLFSPLSRTNTVNESIHKLRKRVSQIKTKEIVIATDFTLEGDSTALFLKKELKDTGINISRLALGIPVGLSLDYVDSGTLARALSGRNAY